MPGQGAIYFCPHDAVWHEKFSRERIGLSFAGGVGLPLVTQLGRLGVGTIVVIDPDRLQDINLPRMPEATRLDAMMPLRRIAGSGGGVWARHIVRLANRLSTQKVRLARRAVRRANRDATFIGIPGNVTEPEAANELVDCDYIFLAADSHLARMIVVPAVQLGTRIDVDEQTGEVADIRCNVRWVLPAPAVFAATT